MARITLSNHWKFLRLARALDSRVLARGVLETIWEPCWASGDPYLGTSDDIESICEWRGKPGALTQALLAAGGSKGAGFIEPYTGDVRDTSEPHYQVHDFFDHCPTYVKVRRNAENGAYPRTCEACGEEFFATHPRARFCKNACRQAAHRGAVTEPVTDPLRNNAETSLAKPSQAYVRTNADGRAASSAAPTAEMPGLERPDVPDVDDEPDERNLKELERTSGHETHAALATTPIVAAIVLTFPVVGKGGPSWHLREDQIAHWRELYPDLDIVAEARKALAWIEADKTRRKTAGGMSKCLVSWFNRSVDSPRQRGPTLVTGSLKTAGNKAALAAFVARGRTHES